jgi:hypothetical protein
MRAGRGYTAGSACAGAGAGAAMLWQLCASAESSGPSQPPTSLATAGRASNPLSTSRAPQRGRCPAQIALSYDAEGGAGFFLASMLEMAR